jgi:hypothetical protein
MNSNKQGLVDHSKVGSLAVHKDLVDLKDSMINSDKEDKVKEVLIHSVMSLKSSKGSSQEVAQEVVHDAKLSNKLKVKILW